MLKGEKVILRAVEHADLDKLRAWRNTPEIRSRCREFKLLSQPHQETWFESLHKDKYPSSLMFAVTVPAYSVDENRKAPKLIGCVGICYIDWHNRGCEISFYIGDRDYHRKGHCADALKVLLTYAFHELGMRRVFAEHYVYNTAGAATLSRLGFKKEGTLRSVKYHDGQWHDSELSSILNHEWKNGGSA